MHLIIASRKSDLARVQAYMVGSALKEKNPALKIKYRFSASLGDKNQIDPLWKMPQKGVFTQDFRVDLLNKKIDMVVHSWKDLPIELDKKTILAATLPRADCRDLLLVKKSTIKDIKSRKILRLLSSSPRRMFNLEFFLKNAFPGGLNEVVFEDVRGNIQTRLDKMIKQKVDGLIVAKAAIDRLLISNKFNQKNDNFDNISLKIRKVIDECEFMILPISANPPAAAQGALVVEIADGRKDLVKILNAINCKKTFNDVKMERKILASYGGGCHQKIGVWRKSIKQGQLISKRGETEKGIILEKFSLLHNENIPKNILSEKIFQTKNYANMFLRKEIAPNEVDLFKIANADILFLASAHIPNSYLQEINNQIIWVSGIKSWFKFAKKNIWVNGSDDSLGIYATRKIFPLLNKEATWLTLTHKDSISSFAIGTYKLDLNIKKLDIKDREYFYWRSASAFKHALKLEPKIINKTHACGLGKTYDIIRKILKKDNNLFVFINEEDWLNQISK